MNNIISENEKINIALYRDYKITEWREKSLILTKEEAEYVLGHLTLDDDPLIQLVKLPFPKFAHEYFKKYEESFKYAPNILREQLGYNLYMLRDYQIMLFSDFMRGKTDIPSKAKYNDLKDAFEDLNISFDNPLKVDRHRATWKDLICKKIYISQYINAEEAKRMQLTDHTFYQNGEYKGFELNEKIECLNGITKTILQLMIGCDGYYRHITSDLYQIAKYQFLVTELGNILLPSMSKTTGEFKSKIGLVGEIEDYKNSFKVYNYAPFKKLDFEFNYKYFVRNNASEAEKEILNNLPAKERRIYVAYVHFYKNVKSVKEVLELSIGDASMFVEEIEKGKQI